MARVFKEETFGPNDEVVTYRVPSGFTLGKIAVFGRVTSSFGAASLRVFGSFESPTSLLGGGGTAGSGNEIQTLDFNDIGSGDTFALTYGGNPSTSILFSADMSVAIAAALADALSGPDISNLGTALGAGTPPEFISQQLPNRGDDTADQKPAGVARAGSPVDYPYVLGIVLANDIIVTQVSTSVYTVTFQGSFTNTDVGAITITSPVGFTPTGVTETYAGGLEYEEITDTATLATAIGQVVTDTESRYPYLTLAYNGDGNAGLTAEAYVVFY